VVPVVERIDLGCTSNPMRVLICLMAPPQIRIKWLVLFKFNKKQNLYPQRYPQ
jgi:hypothetical protein